ncbi:hypothetical protein VTO42DRAFT_4161 [Malbranchea cinnamomea]
MYYSLVNEKLYPDLNPIIYHPTLHAIYPKQWQDQLTDIIWYVLFAVVETHRAIQTSSFAYNAIHDALPRDADHHLQLNREVYGYKSRAFRLLNEELQRPDRQLNDMTLTCVLTLLLAETQLAAVGGWHAHFQGANKIIQVRGGLAAVFRQIPYWRNDLLKYFMLADICGAATEANLLLSDAERQLEYRPLIEEFFDNGSGTCVPFPDELLNAMIQVNYLRAASSSNRLVEGGDQDAITDNDTGTLKSSVRDVLERILSFSASQWSTRMANKCPKTIEFVSKVSIKPGFIRPTRDDWLCIASVYHAAVLLYCIRSLALDFDELFCFPCPVPGEVGEFGANGGSGEMLSYVTIQDIQVVARQTLTDEIRAIFSLACSRPSSNSQSRHRPSQPLGKIVVWPLFVAGVEAAVDVSSFYPPSRYSSWSRNEALDLVCNAMRKLSKDIGTLNLLDAVAFLTREWESNCQRWWLAGQLRHEIELPGEKRWWNEIVASLQGGGGVFFM